MSATRAFIEKVHQLVELTRDARVLAQSLEASAPGALERSSAYSETTLSHALDSIQSAIPALRTFVKKSRKYTNLDRFTLFPKLPIEVRIQIWKEVMPGPRVLPAWLVSTKGTKTLDHTEVLNLANDSDHRLAKMLIHHPPPTALSICQESREEALKRYSWTPDTINCFSPDRVDPVEDIVYIHECS